MDRSSKDHWRLMLPLAAEYRLNINLARSILLAGFALSCGLLAAPVSAEETLIGAEARAEQSLMVLTAESGHSSENLVVGPQQTMVIDFSSNQTLSIAGILNAGTIYALSTNPDVLTGTINFSTLSNLPYATFTSVLPVNGLPGFSNALPSFNLLFRGDDVNNAGVISSSGNLFISANTISNSGSITAAGSIAMNATSTLSNLLATAGASLPATVMPPSVDAITNLSLTAGHLINQGRLASHLSNTTIVAELLTNTGSINALDSIGITSRTETLLVENSQGSMRAANIVFSTADTGAKASAEIYGGDLRRRSVG